MAKYHLNRVNTMGKKRKLTLDNLRDIMKLSDEEMKKLGKGRLKVFLKKEDRIVNWVTEILPQ